MFKRCSLHIGTEKTGSTSIQRTLAALRTKLQQEGFLFPKGLGAPDGHRMLATYALDDERLDDGRRKFKLLTKDALSQHRTEVQGEFARLAALHAGKHLILSSEHCHSRLTRVQEVSRLGRLIRQHSETVDVVVYIRPQHELAASLYSTALRVGHVNFPLIPEVKDVQPYYDYKSLLDRWSEVFGRESVHPKIYDKKGLLDGDVVADFFDFVGANLPKSDKVVVSNTNLSGEAQAFLEMINSHLKDGRRNIADALEGLGDGLSAVPGREEANRFFALHDDINDMVRRDWFPERTALFDVDWSSYPEQRIMPTLTMERAFAMFAEIWKSRP
jgi:hypothetical protein